MMLPEDPEEFSSAEKRLLEILEERGPQTLDNLCALPELSGSQALFAVDRLSRSGVVAIHPIAQCEYRVSAVGTESR